MVNVLIVDDSATARALLQEILEEADGIHVVGVAKDAYDARDKVVQLKPDVVCLDVEMPRMDGITFLRKLMQHMPVPVVMISSLTQKGAQVTFDALDAGAIDFVAKPHSNIYDGIDEIKEEIVAKVKSASRARVRKHIAQPAERQMIQSSLATTTRKVIAIGASTGGTTALQDFLKRLPRNTPGIVIVQHMPENFTGPFAERLNGLCEVNVKEAKSGDTVSTGEVLIAPGKNHMVLRRKGAQYSVEIGSGDLVSGHRPSVDVLFNSVSKAAGANAVGIILTGMGADGAKGMLNMHKAGAKTIAQNEETCIVFGMPKVAIELGGVDAVESLEDVAEKMFFFLKQMPS